jgi:hypothetical protein
MSEQENKVSLSPGAKRFAADICAGASDHFLMNKYGLSKRGLRRLLAELIAVNAISQADLDRRASASDTISEHDEVMQEETFTPSLVRMIHSAGMFRTAKGVQIFLSACHAYSGK